MSRISTLAVLSAACGALLLPACAGGGASAPLASTPGSVLAPQSGGPGGGGGGGGTGGGGRVPVPPPPVATPIPTAPPPPAAPGTGLCYFTSTGACIVPPFPTAQLGTPGVPITAPIQVFLGMKNLGSASVEITGSAFVGPGAALLSFGTPPGRGNQVGCRAPLFVNSFGCTWYVDVAPGYVPNPPGMTAYLRVFSTDARYPVMDLPVLP